MMPEDVEMVGMRDGEEGAEVGGEEDEEEGEDDDKDAAFVSAVLMMDRSMIWTRLRAES